MTHPRSPEPGFAAVLSRVTKVYPGRSPVPALLDIDLSVHEGEMVAITGPSGSGKSTLLNLMGGLDVPTSGDVRIMGVEVGQLDEDGRSLFRRRLVSYVFQACHLMPTLSCRENVALPLYLQGWPDRAVSSHVTEALDSVGLGDLADRLPDELSGGECQRAAIARALVTGPRLLLADEPTGNLDSATGRSILGHLSSLRRTRGVTVVLVTHDRHAAEICGRVVRLRDGRLVDDSAP